MVRLISPGRWNPRIEQEDSAGFTSWSLKPDGSLRASHADSVAAALDRALAGEA
jgi:hypothetical protein